MRSEGEVVEKNIGRLDREIPQYILIQEKSIWRPMVCAWIRFAHVEVVGRYVGLLHIADVEKEVAKH